jgi:hypothetical protein
MTSPITPHTSQSFWALERSVAELTHTPLKFLTSVTGLVAIYCASCLQRPRPRNWTVPPIIIRPACHCDLIKSLMTDAREVGASRISLTCCKSGCTVLLAASIDSSAGEVYAEAKPTIMDPKDTDRAAMTCNKHNSTIVNNTQNSFWWDLRFSRRRVWRFRDVAPCSLVEIGRRFIDA